MSNPVFGAEYLVEGESVRGGRFESFKATPLPNHISEGSTISINGIEYTVLSIS